MSPTQIFQIIIEFLKSAESTVRATWIWWTCPVLFVIVCFFWQVITYPEAAINQFMITIISSVFVLFPSTPENFKVANLLQSTATAFPLIGWGPVYEIYQGASGLFAISMIMRVWKFLPFT